MCEQRGCCRAQIYRDMEDRGFPRPVKIGPRMAAWVEAEVDAWIKAQIAARDAKAPKAPHAKPASHAVEARA